MEREKKENEGRKKEARARPSVAQWWNTSAGTKMFRVRFPQGSVASRGHEGGSHE